MTTTSPIPVNSAEVAAWLVREHQAQRRFEPFATERGVDTLAKAYEVQRAYMRLQAQARDSRPVGYKIGLTSSAMQAMCGIDTPVAGVVLADRMHSSGVRLSRGDFGRFGVEFELAVRIGHDLVPRGRACTLEDVEAAVDGVAAAMEIVDDRGCDYKTLDVRSLVADNAWNAGIVRGKFSSSWPDLAQVEGRVTVNDGELLDSGRGRDVLGHPLRPIVWLADHLAASGEALRAGDIIMTGSMVTTKFPSSAQHYRFEIGGLGAVELHFDNH
jgi:2-keto-4-pentenoate hydratase